MPRGIRCSVADRAPVEWVIEHCPEGATEAPVVAHARRSLGAEAMARTRPRATVTRASALDPEGRVSIDDEGRNIIVDSVQTKAREVWKERLKEEKAVMKLRAREKAVVLVTVLPLDQRQGGRAAYSCKGC